MAAAVAVDVEVCHVSASEMEGLHHSGYGLSFVSKSCIPALREKLLQVTLRSCVCLSKEPYFPPRNPQFACLAEGSTTHPFLILPGPRTFEAACCRWHALR